MELSSRWSMCPRSHGLGADRQTDSQAKNWSFCLYFSIYSQWLTPSSSSPVSHSPFPRSDCIRVSVCACMRCRCVIRVLVVVLVTRKRAGISFRASAFSIPCLSSEPTAGHVSLSHRFPLVSSPSFDVIDESSGRESKRYNFVPGYMMHFLRGKTEGRAKAVGKEIEFGQNWKERRKGRQHLPVSPFSISSPPPSPSFHSFFPLASLFLSSLAAAGAESSLRLH